jgi:hypothetical protein
MSEISDIFQDIKREFGLDECTVCVRPTSMRDVRGFPWCEEHEHHGKVFSWGARHGFPELKFHIYALGPGEISWWNAVIASAATGSNRGNEIFMWTALIYIEDLDIQNVRIA